MTVLDNRSEFVKVEKAKEEFRSWKRSRPNIWSFQFPPTIKFNNETIPISWHGDDSYTFKIIASHKIDQLQAEEEVKKILCKVSGRSDVPIDSFYAFTSGHSGQVDFISWELIKECAESYLRQMGMKAVPINEEEKEEVKKVWNK